MPNWEAYAEANKRGILSGDKKALYDEAVKRGLVQTKQPVAQGLGGVLQKVYEHESRLPSPEPFNGPTPEWMERNPNLAGVYGAGKGIISKAIRPSVETAAGVGGMLLAPQAPLLGGSLGYTAGKKGMDYVEDIYKKIGGEQPYKRTLTGETVDTALTFGVAYGTGKVADKLFQQAWATDEKLSAAIRKGIEKGIRPQKPSIAKNMTSMDYDAYLSKAESGVKSIIMNKSALQYSNDSGVIYSTGRLPKNLKEFGQAITQTKQKIFQDYDALTKQTGEKGYVLKLSGLSEELKKVASDPSMAVAPNARRYAAKMARRLEKTGEFTPIQAQNAIARINNRLQGFYKNRPYQGANQKSIDDLIVTHLRKGLDDAVEVATGGAYQPLKRDYGALRAIENDVNYRALGDARKSNVGFFGYTDIWTAAEVVGAVVNPANIPKVIGAQGAKYTIKYINDPNRIVRSMFDDADKLITKMRPNQVVSARMKELETSFPELKETGVYRYNPEFKPTKAYIPPKIETTLRPGETPPVIQSKAELARASEEYQRLKTLDRAFKAEAYKQSKRGTPLATPSLDYLKSQRPPSVEELLKRK